MAVALRPSLFVELGTFYGESYFGFCQALQENSIRCECCAVDTWKGDEHGGAYGEEIFSDVQKYNSENYGAFSQLIRMTFDEALASFSDESIDLLHIDGFHSYDSVCHDFESWLPKVRPGGIVLLHDIAIRSRGFGVWRFWEELRTRFSTFAFTHSAGLGVLAKNGGALQSDFFSALFTCDGQEQDRIARYYGRAGEQVRAHFLAEEWKKHSSNPSRCPVQVFYSTGGPYSEEKSVVRVVEVGDWQRISVELPEGSHSRPLRIDPADRPSIVEFAKLEIYADNALDPIWKWEPPDPRPRVSAGGTAELLESEHELTLFSDGSDPQLFLTATGSEPIFERPLRLEIIVRITTCVDSRGRLVPLSSAARDHYLGCLELDRVFLRNEVGSMLNTVASQSAEMRTEIAKAQQTLRVALNDVQRIVSSCEAALADVQGGLRAIVSELEASRAVESTLREALEKERTRRWKIEQSWSWRITAPARLAFSWLTRKRSHDANRVS